MRKIVPDSIGGALRTLCASLRSRLQIPVRKILQLPFFYPLRILVKRVPVWRLEGMTRCGWASCLEAICDSQPNTFTRNFFVGEVQRVSLGTVPLWRLDSFLRTRACDVSLTMVRVDDRSARLLFQRDCLQVPDVVRTALELPASLDSLWKGRGNLKEDLRRVRRYGIRMATSDGTGVTHDGLFASTQDADFDRFYRTMYLPSIARQYRDLARPANEDWLRSCFRRGRIIWAMQGAETLAGVVVDVIDNVLYFRVTGGRGGDAGKFKEGDALYLFAVQYAKEQGCSRVEFGSCRASMTDGVLRFKRKWGMRVRPREDNHNLTLIRWHVWSQAVSTFLEDAAVLHQGSGELQVITACTTLRAGTQADADRVYRAMYMAGVGRLVVVNAEGWEEGVVPPPLTRLTGGSLTTASVLGVTASL